MSTTEKPVDTSGQGSNLENMSQQAFIDSLMCVVNNTGHKLIRNLCLEAAARLQRECDAKQQPVGLTTLPKQLGEDIYAELFDESDVVYPPAVSKEQRVAKIANRILRHVLHFWPSAPERETGTEQPDNRPVCDMCNKKYTEHESGAGWKHQCSDKNAEFEKLVRPLMAWLNDNYHPHTTIIVTPDSAEVLEVSQCFRTTDYIKD